MGVTSDQILGKTVNELWPSEHARTYRRKDLELMKNPVRQVYEYAIDDKNGLERPVMYSKDVFRDENNQVAGIIGAFMDITKRKQAEEKIKEKEKTIRVIYETSNIFNSNLKEKKKFDKLIKILPSAFKFPELICVRIVYGNNIFQSIQYFQKIA